MHCHLTREVEGAAGLLLACHGRDGAGHSAHMLPIIAAYAARGWRVAAPDFGWSRAVPGSGPPEAFTMQAYLDQARELCAWLQGDAALVPPSGRIALAGHSMGAYVIARLAAETDLWTGTARLDHLLAVSPVVSGAALLAAREAMGPPAVEALRRDAPRLYAEMLGHDAAPALAAATVPVAVVTGREDGITPVKDARRYFDAAPRACFFAALPGQHHCPAGPSYVRALDAALDALLA